MELRGSGKVGTVLDWGDYGRGIQSCGRYAERRAMHSGVHSNRQVMKPMQRHGVGSAHDANASVHSICSD